MTINGTDIFMTRGDSENIKVTLSGYTLMEGDYVELTIRKTPRSAVVLHKKVTEFSDNSAVISILPEDTEALQFGDYMYDIQLTFSGVVKTIIKPSKLTVGEEITYG